MLSSLSGCERSKQEGESEITENMSLVLAVYPQRHSRIAWISMEMTSASVSSTWICCLNAIKIQLPSRVPE
ncbi:hypothetical protein ACS0TY_013972 [Phlomoides rotata]